MLLLAVRDVFAHLARMRQHLGKHALAERIEGQAFSFPDPQAPSLLTSFSSTSTSSSVLAQSVVYLDTRVSQNNNGC